MGELRLRRATVADAPDMARVHRLSRASYYGTRADPADGREAMWAELVARPGLTAWLAVDGGRVVGFLAVARAGGQEAEVELTSLYVLPDSFGSGIGSRLHDRFVAELGDGDEGVLDVWAGNARAIGFYAARGWVATPVSRPGPGDLDFVTYRLPATPARPLER